jgi:hypothetical protein
LAAFAAFAVSVAILAWIHVSEATKWQASSLLPLPEICLGLFASFSGSALSAVSVVCHERFLAHGADVAVFLIRCGLLELAEARLGRAVEPYFSGRPTLLWNRQMIFVVCLGCAAFRSADLARPFLWRQ